MENDQKQNYRSAIFDTLADGTWVINRSGRIIDVNERAAMALGYVKEDVIGRNIDTIDVNIEKGMFYKLFDQTEKQGIKNIEVRSRKKDGELIDLEVNATVLKVEEEKYYVSIVRDVTSKKIYQDKLIRTQRILKLQKEELEHKNKQLRESQKRNKAIVDVLPDMLFVYSADGVFLDCQTNDEKDLLFTKENFIGKRLTEVMPGDIGERAMRCIEKTLSGNGVQSFEYELPIANETKHFETRMVKVDEEVLAIVRDITSQKREQQLILELSYKDSLTNLYNRRFFEEELVRIKEILPTSLLMIDVNGLKLTNDAFGHIVGDELLQCVADILRIVCPRESKVCRIGGDEFVVILPQVDEVIVEKIADNIYEEISKAMIQEVHVSVSVGWETRTNKHLSVEELFISAENHMFRKKLVESQSMRHKTVTTILETLNEKNEREKRHSENVSTISRNIAAFMGFSEQFTKEIEIAGLLHDIGKIAVREELLNKPGSLTEEEYSEIKRHSESGYQIIKSVDEYSSMAEVILSHHESYDGSGYPRGLRGEDIPISARIITVADAYEAMVSDRSYRKGMAMEEALKELKRCSGTQFDPQIVDALCVLLESDTTTEKPIFIG